MKKTSFEKKIEISKLSIIASFESEDDGRFVYLVEVPMAADQARLSLLTFRLNLTNNEWQQNRDIGKKLSGFASRARSTGQFSAEYQQEYRR